MSSNFGNFSASTGYSGKGKGKVTTSFYIFVASFEHTVSGSEQILISSIQLRKASQTLLSWTEETASATLSSLLELFPSIVDIPPILIPLDMLRLRNSYAISNSIEI
ncbi:hypothetical protein ACH5RR_006784 [Cinchona calisaya]|uniref:Uncharacterized protein n=1 Tax=Cinchona calisaya TaxID=153742 RepID=A0ABD3AQ10_9GENT